MDVISQPVVIVSVHGRRESSPAPRRGGISYCGEARAGFSYDASMARDDQRRVARWARQLAPDDLTPEQRELLETQPKPVVSSRRVEGLRQDQLLRSPLVRDLWARLRREEQQLVLNPDARVGGTRYPLATNELALLTGLTRRQVQYWSDRQLLPHWTDERGHRRFEAPAAVIAFALRGRSQHERQFYADVGAGAAPLLQVCDAVSMVGLRALELARSAPPADLARTEELFRTVADSIHELRGRIEMPSRTSIDDRSGTVGAPPRKRRGAT